MRYFLDTEFIEDGKTINLISIGVVAEDGREFYAELPDDEIPWHQASEWVLDHVRPLLKGGDWVLPREMLRQELLGFISGSNPEIWAYYADYDWVVVAQLFGTMMDLPSGWPMFCMDLKQLAVMKGDPELPQQTSIKHHALADARWVRDAYARLVDG